MPAVSWRTRLRTLLALLLVPLAPLVAIAGGGVLYGVWFGFLVWLDGARDLLIAVAVPFGLGTLFAAAFQGTALWRAFRRGGAGPLADVETRRGEGALRETVDRLAAQADLPAPEVRVVKTLTAEAFTVRDDEGRATVVVSEGLLRTLDDRELRAVLAHELAHLRDRDVTVMEWATVPLAATDEMTDAMQGEGLPVVKFAMRTLLGWYGAACAAVVAAGREYGADAGAAEITGDPDALASALATLDESAASRPSRDLRERSDLAALNVVPASRGTLFSTHPPTEERIERLRRLAGERA